MVQKTRLGVLVSGSGSNLQAIMDACHEGKIDAEVVVVGSDNPKAYGLERAAKAGIPTFTVSYSDAKHRFVLGDVKGVEAPADYDVEDVKRKMGKHAERLGIYGGRERAVAEAELLQKLDSHRIDLLVLAGFMRLLTPWFIDRMNRGPLDPRIENIHPALLPSFPGTNGYEDTWNYGCKVYGSTVHFVDYGEDTGPIIGQTALVRRPDMTLEQFKKEGLAAEWELFPACIQLFAEGRLSLETSPNGRKVVKIADRAVAV